MAIAASLLPGAAGAASTTLNVTATVRPYTRVVVLSAPESLTVTAADAARGFVDVPSPMLLEVRTNRREGAPLLVAAIDDFVQQTTILGPAGPVVVGPAGGVLLLSTPGPGIQALVALRFRLALAPGSSVGTRAWPIRVSSQVI